MGGKVIHQKLHNKKKKERVDAVERVVHERVDISVIDEVSALYESCINEKSPKIRQTSIRRIVSQQSAAETIVWPSILRWDPDQKFDGNSNLSIDKLCFLFAVLTSWEYSDGGALSALSYVKSDSSNERAWEVCCNSIFSPRQLKLHGKGNRLYLEDVWAVQTHFLIVSWAAVWIRELEIRRQPDLIQQEWKDIERKSIEDNESNMPIFISNVLQHLLHLVETKASKKSTQGEGEFSFRSKRKRDYNSSESVSSATSDDENENNQPHEYESEHESEDDVKEENNIAGVANLDQSNADEGTDSDWNQADSTLLSSTEWKFIHRSLELLIDLLSSSTGYIRRFLVPYLLSIHWTIRFQRAITNNVHLSGSEHHHLAMQLFERVQFWIRFPIQIECESHSPNKNDSIKYLDSVALRSVYYRRAAIVQKMCHRHYKDELAEVVHAGVGLLCSPLFLHEAFRVLKDTDLANLLHKMHLVDSLHAGQEIFNREFLMSILHEFLVVPQDMLEDLRTYPLYPTENDLWNFSLIPPGHTKLLNSPILSLPKLQIRFLSFADYLWRNFELVRLESGYEIRSDLTSAIRRLQPVVRHSVDAQQGYLLDTSTAAITEVKTEFKGWARMAIEISTSLEIKRVRKPFLGETHPSSVLAEFSIDLSRCGEGLRREWDELGEHDVLFLIAVDASKMTGSPAPFAGESQFNNEKNLVSSNTNQKRISDENDSSFPTRFGVQLVRGCKIVHVRDQEGTIISDPSNTIAVVGLKRFYLVELDPTQYSFDAASASGTDLYQTLNLVVRRHGKTNNFRSVLETIRGLLVGMGSINRVVPKWLQPVLLGQGDPSEASYKSETLRTYSKETVGVSDPDSFLDYGDTFLNDEHLRFSFSVDESTRVTIDSSQNASASSDSSRKNYRVRVMERDNSMRVEADTYPPVKSVTGNMIRFTPVQVEAIRSGLSPGLTLVVGPPGTGKSDTAVQIISCLYHSFPTQRTVVIAHSNTALNEIFQKVVARGDIHERFLLRLGAGERQLQTTSSHDFSKIGRVAYSLDRRRVLLEKVQVLAESLSVSKRSDRGHDGSSAFSCDTAATFNKHEVLQRIRIFRQQVKDEKLYDSGSDVTSLFPFIAYCEKENTIISLSDANELFGFINELFYELADYRPFELLRSQRQRSDYLITKQARIVAMTCTHAAIARSHLIELGFEYDNLIVEEAGQMLEIETFIPLLLQRGDGELKGSNVSTSTRLKRLCLMGDHNQLPPVVQNSSFSKYSNLDQSLFTRLIRLGVPYIQLDKQGRSRPEIASLFSWRYEKLGNLDHVYSSKEFTLANAGLANCFQVINVEDFEGKGETSPTPYYYQNVGEAEYIVALFQYMVLIGYPPQKISIITTYNGQKELITDVLAHRCGIGTPLAGAHPLSISTVDQFQGQQNDIILLSLVRTESVGHLRDIRRLIVAVSRARLGLYVFCRQNLFDRCHELESTFTQFRDKANKLQLVVGETFPSNRKNDDVVPAEAIFEVEDVTHMGNLVHKMQLDLLTSRTKENS